MKINRTVERTVEILELLSKEKNGLTVKEISEIMKIPKTSAYDILETLVHLEILEKNLGELNLYKIGLKSFQIGNSYSRNKEIFKIIDKPMQELAEKTGKTVFYAVENDGEIVYISKHESEKAIITTAGIGSTNPMYCTSLGKAMLAFFQPGKIDSLISMQSFEKKTQHTLSKEELIKELTKIRTIGYAIDNREIEEHMLCIGAPVFDSTKNVVGAVSISGLFSEDRDIDCESAELLKTCSEISRKLGY
ncbi:IclR family transcriptional regulator [uncultured Ilyobacter sp.]|uniref:IclR family transcriptional regulator n=1 Tax=uncultured Ilyobacter sp. TaxID=544433 RepID=UPI0029F53C3F|nr:IclR family transcriptional regulator [uncultured Ilyobacter sp.]